MLELYGYSRDPFAWSARFAAEEKGLSYQWLPGDVGFPDPRVAKHNPAGRSPLLLHEGFQVSGAIAVLLYVDEAFPGRTLQPASPRERAETRMFNEMLEVLPLVVTPGAPEAAGKKAFKRVNEVFATVENMLGDGRPWLDGAQLGLRDIVFLPLLSDLESLEISFAPTHERLGAYWERAIEHPTFVKTNYKNAPIQGKR